MANDYLKKQPSKTESMLYEMAMHLQHLERNMVTNSAFITALALQAKVDPKVVAEYLTTKREEVHEFSKKINAAIDEIEGKDKNGSGAQAEASGHNHTDSHNHDHDHTS